MFYEDKQSRKVKRDDVNSKRKMAKTDYIETLRKEIYEEPEEVHLGGMTNKKSAFMRQMATMESLEQEHFKRLSLSKSELKAIRVQEKAHL